MSTILKNYSTKLVAALIIIAMVLTAVGISTTTVDAAAKAPTKITLKATYLKVDVNGKTTVSVNKVTPAKASKDVTWKSSNPKVATVNKNGVVTGKKWGNVKITATSKANKKVKATIKLKVRQLKPTGVTVKKSNVTMAREGLTLQLTPKVKPANVYNKGFTYKSSNTTVAIVNSSGKIIAKAPGTATITIKSKEVNKTAKVKVTVSNKQVLEPWVITGYYSATKINNKKVDKDAKVKIWNANTKQFVDAKKTKGNIIGRYVQLIDTDNDKSADFIYVVKRVHSDKYWNADMAWLKGVASEKNNPDQPISDAVGKAMYDVEYRIPMGERQLAHWGLDDWSGTTDWAKYENSPYWLNTDYDWYNLKSSDTLTMLTGYKTSLQETGSTCVMNSALSVLEWYGERGDLNAKDLSSLRSAARSTTGGTSIWELEKVFEKLDELGITGGWEMEGWTDNNDILTESPEWLKKQLTAGHPVIVIWNSYGAHGQVIIGYDDMGTPETNDDVLVMMDPYDTTDHNPDGYIIQSYERLIWGKLTWGDETSFTKCLAVWPEGDWIYEPVKGEGLAKNVANKGNVDDSAAADWDNNKLIVSKDFAEIDGMKIPYDTTAEDLQAYYATADITGVYPYLDTSLSGAAGVERSGDVANSPYYELDDFYGTEAEVQKAVGSDTLDIIDNFSTIQQSTEFSCGVTSAYMAMYNYGMIPEDKDGKLLESDASLSAIRQIDEETGLGEAGATYVEGLDEVFQYMADKYDQKWAVASDQDYVYDDWDYAILGEKYLDNELIPYLVENDVPMLIGWDEWGGHWQVLIGYDDMGTEATQDDVVILADAYDTTDHNQNGYVIESFERLLYGWNSEFETWNDEATGVEDDMYYAMYIAVPDTEEYADVIKTLGLKAITPADDGEVLTAWALNGYYAKNKLNGTKVAANAIVKVWNKDTDTFEPAKNKESVILGNYIQLKDKNKDKVADVVEVVKFEDSTAKWDKDMAWLDGVASEESNPDQPISDEVGRAMFDVEYRIPMGERQLSSWGIWDWSGTTDWAKYENSPYWQNTDYDYYNLKSSDTLTMLTGYKTSLQETGSTCVMNSALSVLEWYGVRGDLNAKDLSSLRGADRSPTGGTSIRETEQVFAKLTELGITGEWEYISWTQDKEKLYDSEWVQSELAKGHPIIVIWNSYGGHGQVIIGYDNMGTPETNDDVLIMMDPYDTTDHNPDGYIIQSYERLAYGLMTWKDDGTTGTKYISVWPKEGWTYEAAKGEGMPLDKNNIGNVDGSAAADWEAGKLIVSKDFAEIDGMKIPYDTTAADLQAYYAAADKTGVYPYLDTGLSGAAGVERSGDVAYSPYYQLDDFYGTEAAVQKAVGSDTLDIIDNFATIQQSTEFSCGVTSAYQVMYNYGMIPKGEDGKLLESDASLSKVRQIDAETGLGAAGATYVEGLDEVFQYMVDTYGQKWAVASDQDYVEDKWGYLVLGEKYQDNELIPYLIENDVPMIIGWDEWGGHWQVVIGYDDMGTEATQDDILILADPYDTTDHNQNGYVLESFERLLYGWNSAFETWNDEVAGYEDDNANSMYIAVPDTAEYADVIKTLGLKSITPKETVPVQ